MRVFTADGRIAYGNVSKEFESIFRYGSDGFREVLQKRPDGRDILVQTLEDESIRITDPKAISAWMSNHASTHSRIGGGLGH